DNGGPSHYQGRLRRVATYPLGLYSRRWVSPRVRLDFAHAMAFGLRYRDSRLSLGLFSHTLIEETNNLPIACVSKVQVDRASDRRPGCQDHGGSSPTN